VVGVFAVGLTHCPRHPLDPIHYCFPFFSLASSALMAGYQIYFDFFVN
jgi:hypothetical protein